jgi:hypothetical protein
MSKKFSLQGLSYEMVNDNTSQTIGKFDDFNIVKSLLAPNISVFCTYPKSLMIIDIDDEITSSIVLDLIKTFSVKCYVLKTTRGIHVYFKKPKDAKNLKKIGVLMVTGLRCDYLAASNQRERIVKAGVVRD